MGMPLSSFPIAIGNYSGNKLRDKYHLTWSANMKNFQSMVEETRILVQAEIKDKENRPSDMLDKQLYSILKKLQTVGIIRIHWQSNSWIYLKSIKNYSNILPSKFFKTLMVPNNLAHGVSSKKPKAESVHPTLPWADFLFSVVSVLL